MPCLPGRDLGRRQSRGLVAGIRGAAVTLARLRCSGGMIPAATATLGQRSRVLVIRDS